MTDRPRAESHSSYTGSYVSNPGSHASQTSSHTSHTGSPMASTQSESCYASLSGITCSDGSLSDGASHDYVLLSGSTTSKLHVSPSGVGHDLDNANDCLSNASFGKHNRHW